MLLDLSNTPDIPAEHVEKDIAVTGTTFQMTFIPQRRYLFVKVAPSRAAQVAAGQEEPRRFVPVHPCLRTCNTGRRMHDLEKSQACLSKIISAPVGGMENRGGGELWCRNGASLTFCLKPLLASDLNVLVMSWLQLQGRPHRLSRPLPPRGSASRS